MELTQGKQYPNILIYFTVLYSIVYGNFLIYPKEDKKNNKPTGGNQAKMLYDPQIK